jgi:hypothetical protein
MPWKTARVGRSRNFRTPTEFYRRPGCSFYASDSISFINVQMCFHRILSCERGNGEMAGLTRNWFCLFWLRRSCKLLMFMIFWTRYWEVLGKYVVYPLKAVSCSICCQYHANGFGFCHWFKSRIKILSHLRPKFILHCKKEPIVTITQSKH